MTVAPNARPWLFKPGNPGGGRPKKLLPRVDEMLYRAGVHPVTELLALYKTTTENNRVKIMLELLAYVCAKPREIVEDDPLSKKTISELWEMIKENMPAIEKAAG